MIRIKNPIAPRLPVEYQEVQYIESTGTQYIDTGFKPNQNTSVEIKILIPSSQENNFVRFFETRNADSSVDGSFGILSFRDTNQLLQYRYNGSKNLSNGQLSTKTEYILKADKNKLYVNDVLKITQTSTTFQVNYNLLLFGFHTPSNRTNANGIYKLYYFKLYDNGTLVRDTVPCYRKSDNESGLYDLVNNTFYPNAGTGVFLRGNEVNKRDANIKPMLGNKPLIRRYAGDKLVYGREPSSYEQLVNYTMLYDYGDECMNITGGWENSFTQGGGTFTRNSDHLYLYVKGSTWKKCAGTKNKIDMSSFSKIYTRCKASRTSASPGICPWGLTSEFKSSLDGDSEQLSRGWILTNTNDFEGFRSIDLSNITNAHVNFKVQSNSSSNATTLYIYSVFMVKEDNWQMLASIAGITASSIDDILNNSSALLANKEAVDFMMYQCTGSFMASAVTNETFLTALNNSPYNTVIQANEHWNKFLSMVA